MAKKNPLPPNGIPNYWMENYGCTRNQARRIKHGVRHNDALDGVWGDYTKRRSLLRDAGEV